MKFNDIRNSLVFLLEVGGPRRPADIADRLSDLQSKPLGLSGNRLADRPCVLPLRMRTAFVEPLPTCLELIAQLTDSC